ncbi:cation/H(+) antiporter 15-like [Hevea brasiliensis]|uniref:cation/H(+) antiporter 15-like n=1 Tax=Hevea brasiliensis TaxID=3981 RepID=UPI0025EAF0D4|nr:cation/H(+) antiporter 15-like [Hevea brasiliensis]
MSRYSGLTTYVKHGELRNAHPVVCFSYQEEKRNHNIFSKDNNDNPLKFIFPVLMLQIILAFVLSRLIYLLFRPLRQSKFVCNVLAGIILGPSVLGRNKKFMETFYPAKEMQVLNTLVKFGVSYFVFLTAVKRDTASLLKIARNAWTIGISGYMIPVAISFFFNSTVEYHVTGCFGRGFPFPLVACPLTQSSFPVVANNLEEQDLITTELGQLAMSIAILSETITNVISNIFVVVIIFTRIGSYLAAFQIMFLISAVILFAIYIVRPTVLQIIKRTPEGKSVQEVFVVTVLLLALFMALIADILWGAFIPGAVLIGLAVPDGPPLGSTIVEKSELIVTEIFLPLFYIQIGYLTDMSSVKDMNSFLVFLLILMLLHLSKILGIMLISLFFDIRIKNGLLLGVVLSFKGVEDFSFYERWQQDKLLDKQCYATIVLFCLFLNSIVCPLVDILYKPHVRLTTTYHHTKALRLRTLQSTPKDVELRVLSCVYHEDNVHGLIALIKAFNPNKNRAVCAYVTHLVELVGRAAPLLIPYNKHRRRFIPKNSHHIMRAFNNFATDNNNSSGPITIQSFIAIAPYKSMHNIICNLAQDRHIPLIIVPFSGNQEVNRVQNSIRNFNTMLQEQASCTVGILIDRGLCLRMINLNRHFKVAVLFIGGADDREALALASRMSGSPKVGINVFKICCKQEEGKVCGVEKQLDEISLKEFKEKNVGNACVVCSEMVANNSLQMMDVVRSLRKKYNLVIVGKNLRRTQFEKEMMQWVEYQELGLVGDVLASSDFCDISVLVIKHSELDKSNNNFCPSCREKLR